MLFKECQPRYLSHSQHLDLIKNYADRNPTVAAYGGFLTASAAAYAKVEPSIWTRYDSIERLRFRIMIDDEEKVKADVLAACSSPGTHFAHTS